MICMMSTTSLDTSLHYSEANLGGITQLCQVLGYDWG